MDKLLRESGVSFEKVNYYIQPLSRKKLTELIRKMNLKPRELLRKSEPARFDPTRASQLEVEWWRVHREHQHAGDSPDGLIGARTLMTLYSRGSYPQPRLTRGAS